MRTPGAFGATVALSLFISFAGATSATSDVHAAVWPDVPDRVRAELASPDASRRRVAAAALESLPRAEAIPLLMIALADPSVEVRIAASASAARRSVTEVSAPIVAWLTDTDGDARLREAACVYLAAVPDSKAVKVLARALGDGEVSVRLAAVRALAASRSSDAVAPLLARLDDGNSKVRFAVARALGRLGDRRAVTPLVAKVQDEAPEVRQAVARALGDLGDARAASSLVITLRDPVPEVRVEALGALGRLRAADAVASIAPLAIASSTRAGAADVRRAALAALGRIGTQQAIDAVIQTLGTADDDRDPHGLSSLGPTPARDALVRIGAAATPALLTLLQGDSTRTDASARAASAAWALAQIRPVGAGDAIVRAMRSGILTPIVTLHSLAILGDATQLAFCLEHVASVDPDVRAEALAATRRLLDPAHPDGRAVEPLLQSLDLVKDADPAKTAAARADIATLLGRTGAVRVAPTLEGLVSAHDEGLRIAAIDALGALSAPSSAPLLVKLLDDPSGAVRFHAALALGRAGDAASVGTLLDRLEGAAEVDRLALVLALGGLFERHADDTAIARARKVVASGLGSERDLLVVAIGRATVASATPALVALLTPSSDVDLRRAVASALGGRTSDAAAIAALHGLLRDADSMVRAQAAWSLGAIGGVADVPAITSLLGDPSTALVANAVAALGRIGARSVTADIALPLCTALTDDRPYVRANAGTALALLAKAGQRAVCTDPNLGERLLTEDPSDLVRRAVAGWMGARIASSRTLAASGPGSTSAAPTGIEIVHAPVAAVAEDACSVHAHDPSSADLCDLRSLRTSLDRCTVEDPSGLVAAACRAALRPMTASATDAAPTSATLVVFVAPDGVTPHAPFALERSDGLLHLGVTDARGAVTELALPPGEVVLRPAS